MAERDDDVDIAVARERLDVLVDKLWNRAAAAFVVGPLGSALTIKTQDMLVRLPLAGARTKAMRSFRCDIEAWRSILASFDSDVLGLNLILRKAANGVKTIEISGHNGSHYGGRWTHELVEQGPIGDRDAGELDAAVGAYDLCESPAEPPTPGVAVRVDVLRRLIDSTMFARAPEAQRYRLERMLFQSLPDGGLRVAGSDGKRIAFATTREAHRPAQSLPRAFTLAPWGVSALRQLLDLEHFETVIHIHIVSGTQVAFRVPGGQSCLVVNGENGNKVWPAYEQILPEFAGWPMLAVNPFDLRETTARVGVPGGGDTDCKHSLSIAPLGDAGFALRFQNHNHWSGFKATGVVGAKIHGEAARWLGDIGEGETVLGSWNTRFIGEAAAAWCGSPLAVRSTITIHVPPLNPLYEAPVELLVFTASDPLIDWFVGTMPLES